MSKILTVHPLDGYKIEVRFEDGGRGVVDLSSRLWGPVFEELKDPAFFQGRQWMSLERFVGRMERIWLPMQFMNN
jgi:hypothetical protein